MVASVMLKTPKFRVWTQAEALLTRARAVGMSEQEARAWLSIGNALNQVPGLATDDVDIAEADGKSLRFKTANLQSLYVLLKSLGGGVAVQAMAYEPGIHGVGFRLILGDGVDELEATALRILWLMRKMPTGHSSSWITPEVEAKDVDHYLPSEDAWKEAGLSKYSPGATAQPILVAESNRMMLFAPACVWFAKCDLTKSKVSLF